ncbi:hypothetical protein REPUB_Repub06bG0165800 [Reevesia pubescens]
MTLISSNGMYSMRLGNDFIGLYAKFDSNSDQIYWKHKALEAKAQIIEGNGPIHLQVDSDGWLGMYQNGTIAPVDVESFNSFQRPLDGLLIVRLEPDGNLKAYYWAGSSWVLDYQAISETCDLPNPCGSYGLCTPGSGCSCLDNNTEFSSGECFDFGLYFNDLCTDPKTQNNIKVLRREGVELPFKELMRYETTTSLEECEDSCEKNCSCFGAVYNNVSGFCYILDYPIQTLLGVGEDSKVGYFKMKEGARKKKMDAGLVVGIGLLGGAIVCLIGAIGFGSYKIWKSKRGVNRILEEEASGVISGPYKDLRSTSFKSIELCRSGSNLL